MSPLTVRKIYSHGINLFNGVLTAKLSSLKCKNAAMLPLIEILLFQPFGSDFSFTCCYAPPPLSSVSAGLLTPTICGHNLLPVWQPHLASGIHKLKRRSGWRGSPFWMFPLVMTFHININLVLNYVSPEWLWWKCMNVAVGAWLTGANWCFLLASLSKHNKKKNTFSGWWGVHDPKLGFI